MEGEDRGWERLAKEGRWDLGVSIQVGAEGVHQNS